jgi:hypothetical protein
LIGYPLARHLVWIVSVTEQHDACSTSSWTVVWPALEAVPVATDTPLASYECGCSESAAYRPGAPVVVDVMKHLVGYIRLLPSGFTSPLLYRRGHDDYAEAVRIKYKRRGN